MSILNVQSLSGLSNVVSTGFNVATFKANNIGISTGVGLTPDKGITLSNSAARGIPVTLTDATYIAIDLNKGNHFTITLGGNRTLAAPNNVLDGQSGIITVKQPSNGGYTLSFNTSWKFPSGVTPSLSTSGHAVDLLPYYVVNSTHVAVSSLLNLA